MRPAGARGPDELGLTGPLPDCDLAPAAGSRAVDRRTLLVGAAGALAVAGLSGPGTCRWTRVLVLARSGRHFDPELARELQQVLDDALRDPGIHAPGAILHVQSPRLGRWTGAAGLARREPAEAMLPRDHFRAGSIVKPFVAAAVLQLAERGRLALDARLPDVLPASVASRFAHAGDITVRMLLATAPGSLTGTAPPSTSRSRAIPPRYGQSASSWTSRPPSRRCSHRVRASPTPTPTTPCSA